MFVLWKPLYELKVKKEGAKKAKAAKDGGWFSGWWGGGKKETTETEPEIGVCPTVMNLRLLLIHHPIPRTWYLLKLFSYGNFIKNIFWYLKTLWTLD